MRAVQFNEVGAPLLLTDVPRPTPGPGECLVKVRAVGLCGSDVHIVQGHTATAFTPITLGHEIAGVVAEISGDDAAIGVGDHVFVNPMVGCGTCPACAALDAASCSRRRILGIHLDGGLADFVVAPTRNLTRMPSEIPFGVIALIESAGTANRALRLVGARAGDAILIVGAGGLGLPAVRLARAQGCVVVTVDTDPVARQRSLDAGATASFDPLVASTADIGAAFGPDGFSGAIDCVGAPATVRLALTALAPLGRCAIVGIGSRAVELSSAADFVRRGLQVTGVYGYADLDIAEVIGRVVDKTLDLAPSISSTVGLNEVNEGLAQFANRENSPARVIVEI